MSLKMFNGNDLPQELLLTARQKTKLRNAFNNNMSTDLKLSKTQISKIIQSGAFLGSLLSKLAGPLMKVAITAASGIDALIKKKKKKKKNGSGTTTLSMNNIMKIVPALEDSNILLNRDF